MIGLILAAGKGSRLGNRTEETPKSLLPLNEGETLLDYNIKVLKKLKVSKILIVTGFESDKIEQHILKYENVEIIYNPFWNHCNVLGSLYIAFPYLKQANEDFLFLHADTIVEMNVWENLSEHNNDIVLPFKRKACGEEEMKVKLNNYGNIILINKEMLPPEADGEFLGIAKFSNSVINYMMEIAHTLFKSGNLNFYMEAIVQKAIDSGRIVTTFDIKDSKFIEVDFEEDYFKLLSFINDLVEQVNED